MEKNGLLTNVSILFLTLCCCLFVTGCDEGNKEKTQNSEALEITDFEPKEVCAGSRMTIYGENFGTDVSALKLKIGGIETPIQKFSDRTLTCLVPLHAYDGTIELTIGENSIKAPQLFTYVADTQVRTLCGTVNSAGTSSVKDGSFDECRLVDPRWMSLDPQNPKHIYMIENGVGIRMMDLTNRLMSTLLTNQQMNISRPESIEWSPDGNTMYISQWQDNSSNNIITLKRDENFLVPHPITLGYTYLYTAIPHPQNGEIYFSDERAGGVYRYDPASGQPPRELMKFGDWTWLKIFFHPSGDYAYIVRVREEIIYKCKYNRQTKTLEAPQPLVGAQGSWGRKEGKGTEARFAWPWQGVFVENEEYVKQDAEDKYDFYLADPSHEYLADGQGGGNVIWKITPDGTASIYAGMGGAWLDNLEFGYMDGDLRKDARFNCPLSLVYDKESKTFYVGERGNHRIRYIAVE